MTPVPPPILPPPPDPNRRPRHLVRVNALTLWILVIIAVIVAASATCLLVGRASTECKYDAENDRSVILTKKTNAAGIVETSISYELGNVCE